MLRMVFEIVMALAVILCLVFFTKVGSAVDSEDIEPDNRDESG